MSSKFINGAKYGVSTAVAAAVAITDISNANPAVALTATPPQTGDIVVLSSGWPGLQGTVARVGAVVAGVSFELEGVDTTDVVEYPAGEGLGAFEVASTFVSLSQVRDVQPSGGEPNFYNFQYYEDKSSQQRQRPTFKSARSMKISMDDDNTLPWHAALKTLDKSDEPAVLRETLPSGDVIYYYAYVSYNDNPTKALNENMQVEATFSVQGQPVRYAGV